MVQIFFSFGPLGVSSMTQPLAFNSSRIASARLKSFALRAACRASSKARISAGISASDFVPMPRTESTFVPRGQRSCWRQLATQGIFAPSRRFISRTHSNTAAQAAEMFKSSSSAAVKSLAIVGSCRRCRCLDRGSGDRYQPTSRSLPRHSSIRASAVRAPCKPSSVKLNVSR